VLQYERSDWHSLESGRDGEMPWSAAVDLSNTAAAGGSIRRRIREQGARFRGAPAGAYIASCPGKKRSYSGRFVTTKSCPDRLQMCRGHGIFVRVVRSRHALSAGSRSNYRRARWNRKIGKSRIGFRRRRWESAGGRDVGLLAPSAMRTPKRS